jgi:hypothetical protein
MRSSMKWSLWATLFCFLPFLYAVFFRAPTGMLTRSHGYLEGKLYGGLIFATIVWLLYGLVYLFGRKSPPQP